MGRLTDRRRHPSVLVVRSFRAVDFDTDHYLMVAKGKERLAENKQRSQSFHMEMFNLKKFNTVEVKGKFRVEVSDWFAALDWMLMWKSIVHGKRLERI
jgi:hypothetical protein